ncbi:hypothetical protein CSW63_00365 (plasmid) [Caulobacter sp. FWC26]|nr:hypothetical protein CSW63_00365 [Caulobacter sp. FWC26]
MSWPRRRRHDESSLRSGHRRRRRNAPWASDASAVEHRPSQRWLLGTPGPVPLSEVLSALRRLDRDTFS